MKLAESRKSADTLTTNTSLSTREKRELGAYYTTKNPFTSPAFFDWVNSIPPNSKCVEPFAGSGNIVTLAREVGFTPTWDLYDVDPNVSGCIIQDTLDKFPTGYDIVLTNPPYLSYHFAKRKGLNISKQYFKGHPNLYLRALELALGEAKWVGFLIPESFITTRLYTERLQHVISLDGGMFLDTEVPVCLALFGPNNVEDFSVWHGEKFIGKYSSLAKVFNPTPHDNKIHFNRVDGQLGLIGIDNTKEASIRFTQACEIPDSKIKNSARLVTRIYLEDPLLDIDRLINIANYDLNIWRKATADVLLTAFKGIRSDGLYRRRLDYKSARSILARAYEATKAHTVSIK